MKSTVQRATLASILSGFAGYVMLASFSHILWRLYPYPHEADELQIKLVWAHNILMEKLFGFLVLAICAIAASLPLRRNWRIGLGAGIGSGLVYQGIVIVTYISRFGFSAFTKSCPFWATIETTIAISTLFSFLTVYGVYWQEYKQRKANIKGCSGGEERALRLHPWNIKLERTLSVRQSCMGSPSYASISSGR